MQKLKSVSHIASTTPPHLFSVWLRIASRIRKANRLALFLDFDGTLAGFKPWPEDVKLSAPARAALARLARHPKVSVFLISGRRRNDLRRRAGAPGVRYIGLHGWERAGKPSCSGIAYRSIRQAHALLTRALAHLPGVRVEDKQFAFAVHYRAAPPASARQAVARTCRLLADRQARIYLVKGDKVVDVLPREIQGKGAAVLDLLQDEPNGTLALYAGDDTTDETAFAALAARGVTILVGRRRKTQARYKLRNPAEVLRFLERLQEELA